LEALHAAQRSGSEYFNEKAVAGLELLRPVSELRSAIMANAQVQIDPEEKLQNLDPKTLGFKPSAEMRTLGTGGGTSGGEEDPDGTTPTDPSGLQALLTIRGDRLFIIASIPLSEELQEAADQKSGNRQALPPGFVRAARRVRDHDSCQLDLRLQLDNGRPIPLGIHLWKYGTEREVKAALELLRTHDSLVHNS